MIIDGASLSPSALSLPVAPGVLRELMIVSFFIANKHLQARKTALPAFAVKPLTQRTEVGAVS